VLVKLLLDENLSVAVAGALRSEDGIDAVHVRDRKMLRTADRLVLEKASAEDRILFTVNVDDFVKLARTSELHAGIVLIQDASLLRGQQLEVIRAAIKHIADHDMVNRVLWVEPDGSMRFEDIPPA